jgi:hypothetical protein
MKNVMITMEMEIGYMNIQYLRKILKTTKFELNHAYFYINGCIFEQENGPMGGFLSALLATIDTMVQEDKHQNLWNTDYGWFRFRDDLLAIIPKR